MNQGAREWLQHGLQLAGLSALGIVLATIIQVAVVGLVTPPWTLRMVGYAQETGDWPTRRVRRLSALGPHGPRAFVASEDARFFLHGGFDNRAICEALKDALQGRRLRGASTISQQVSKNVFLWNRRSLARKGLEVWYTLWLETLLSKQRILELYVNVAETGPGVFGLEAGAQHHFDTGAAKLDRSQAGRLAGILPNPKRSIQGKAAWSRASWLARHPAPFPDDPLYAVIQREVERNHTPLWRCLF